MLATLLIVFREMLEAGLVVGIVLAATEGLPRRMLAIGGGIAAGACGVGAGGGLGGVISGGAQGGRPGTINPGVVCVPGVKVALHRPRMGPRARQVGGGLTA